jgi:hypothetical protein
MMAVADHLTLSWPTSIFPLCPAKARSYALFDLYASPAATIGNTFNRNTRHC